MLRRALALTVLLAASPAAAHIALVSPAPRTTELKAGPCGAAGSVRGTNVAVFRPGATIEVTWKETINHPGHYRISFDPDGQDFTVPLDFNDTTQTTNVLVDMIPDSATANDTYTQSITLPAMACENCTLQVIQMMTDKPPYGDGNDIYYQCADIALRADAPLPPDAGVDAGGGTPAGPDAGGGAIDEPGTVSGGCRAGGDGGAALLVLAAVPLVRRRTRRGACVRRRGR